MAQCFDQVVEAAERALLAGADCGNQDALAVCTLPGSVAAPDVAVHNRRANCLLAAIVPGVQRGIDQEPELMHGMLQQVHGQTSIRPMREAARRQLLHFARRRISKPAV